MSEHAKEGHGHDDGHHAHHVFVRSPKVDHTATNITLLCIGMFVLALVVAYMALHDKHAAPTVVYYTPPYPVRSTASMEVLYGTTPAEATFDYSANVEADGPVLVQYYNETAIHKIEAKGCTELPQPRYAGPKKIWSEDGRAVAFRVYHAEAGCGGKKK